MPQWITPPQPCVLSRKQRARSRGRGLLVPRDKTRRGSQRFMAGDRKLAPRSRHPAGKRGLPTGNQWSTPGSSGEDVDGHHWHNQSGEKKGPALLWLIQPVFDNISGIHFDWERVSFLTPHLVCVTSIKIHTQELGSGHSCVDLMINAQKCTPFPRDPELRR